MSRGKRDIADALRNPCPVNINALEGLEVILEVQSDSARERNFLCAHPAAIVAFSGIEAARVY